MEKLIDPEMKKELSPANSKGIKNIIYMERERRERVRERESEKERERKGELW
jgi:hypothetical protein